MIEKWKRHRLGVLIGGAGILVAAVLILLLPQFLSTVIEQKPKEVSVKIGDNYNADLLNDSSAEPKFRSDAKFKILEIVPYRGMAEIGYSISGEEPIDISKMSQEDFKNVMFQVIHDETRVLAWDNSKKHLINKDCFIHTTLKEGMQLSDKQVDEYISKHLVDVLVVEPSQINAHPELIKQSNYIAIHDDFAKGDNDYFNRLLYLYEKYSYGAMKGTLKKKYYNSGNYPKFTGNGNTSTDLSMDVINKLYHFGVIEEMPLSIPGYTLKGELSGRNNIQKLGYAISTSICVSNRKIISVEECYKKIFTESHNSDWDFWNIKYLVSYLCKGKGNVSEDAIVAEVENGVSDSVNNDFVGAYYNSTICAFAHGSGQESSFLSKMGSADGFASKIKTTEQEKWCENVNNNTRDISIIIYNAYCPTMDVLDIEPDNKFTLSVFDVRSWIPLGIRVKVKIVPMTMSEFIGIAGDLNSDYDMIYFGKNQDRMQAKKLYNKNLPASSSELSTYQGSGVNGSDFLYSGNDITERMVDKVKAFMDAGYPVAYESILKESAIVDDSTNIYKFLNSTKYSSMMYKTTDGTIVSGGSLAGLLNFGNVIFGKAEIYDTLSSDLPEYSEGTSNTIGTGGLDKLSFNTRHGNGTYKAFLYVDCDHNGIYNEWKKEDSGYELDPNYEQPVWETVFTAGDTVNVSGSAIPARAMLGAVSYKLEVVKLSGGALTGIRSNMTGTVKCSGSTKDIKVLQLSDFDSYSNMDLSSNSQEAQEFKKYALSGIVSDRFNIKVTSLDINKTEFAEVDLLEYDVILIGFVNEVKKMSDSDGLLTKLSIAAEKGKGVIFTGDALTYYNDVADAIHWGSNMNHRVRTLLGMDRFKAFASGSATANDSEMAFTYSILNKHSENKYFSGLNVDIVTADAVSRINSAKIDRYPYIINRESTGFHSKSGIYQVDVNQNDSEVVNGVAYFCLDRAGNYSVSPRDVRNNYYLWRNDSVFYSGLTRESFNGSYANEMRLFINTIIAAYGLERSVTIDVTNLDQCGDFEFGKSYMLYVDVDFTDNLVGGENQPVEFKLDTTGMTNPKIKLKFYKADTEGNKVSSALELHRNGNTFSDDSGATSSEFTVNTGTEYTYKYPYSYLRSGANENIRIEAVATEKGKTVTDSVLIKALRRSMFDLD